MTLWRGSGGDEFVLVQPNISGREQAEEFAHRLSSALAEPMRLKEHELFTTVSIGVALAPADGDTPERLLKSADLAVYKAKADGRNCVRFFRRKWMPNCKAVSSSKKSSAMPFSMTVLNCIISRSSKCRTGAFSVLKR